MGESKIMWGGVEEEDNLLESFPLKPTTSVKLRLIRGSD